MYNFIVERFNWLRDNVTASDAAQRMFYETFFDELLDNSFEPFVFVRADGISGVIPKATAWRDPKNVFGIAVVRYRDPHWYYHAPTLLAAADFADRVLLVRSFKVQEVYRSGITVLATVETVRRETFDISICFNVITTQTDEVSDVIQRYIQLYRPNAARQDTGPDAICRKALNNWRTALAEGDIEDAVLTAHVLAAELRVLGYSPALFLDSGAESRFITANSADFDRDLLFLLNGRPEDQLYLVRQETRLPNNEPVQNRFSFTFTIFVIRFTATSPFNDTEKQISFSQEIFASREVSFEQFLNRYIYLI
jgi:hypothetical protein